MDKIHFAYYIKPWLDHMWNMPILFGIHIKNVILLILRKFKKKSH